MKYIFKGVFFWKFGLTFELKLNDADVLMLNFLLKCKVFNVFISGLISNLLFDKYSSRISVVMKVSISLTSFFGLIFNFSAFSKAIFEKNFFSVSCEILFFLTLVVISLI